MALQSLTRRVTELAAPMQGQWDTQQPKVVAFNPEHHEQHLGPDTAAARAGGTGMEPHTKNQRRNPAMKPGKVLMLEEASGNTPARAVVSLAVLEGESSNPLCKDWQGV